MTITQRDRAGGGVEITPRTFDENMRFADAMGADIHDWSGQDRDGRPLQVTWVASKRRGALVATYELTEE